MGLLSSAGGSTGKGRLGKLIRRCSTLLSVLLYVLGLVWFIGVQWPAFNGKTYFSENALLPGLVDEEYQNEGQANNYYRRILQVISDHDANTLSPSLGEWIKKQFLDMKLEAFSQNFSRINPLNPAEVYPGENIYGIIRTQRGASLEGMVLVTPLDGSNAPALALLLTLASFWREKVYWAKDIVFLFADQGIFGTQAWLSGYHEIPFPYLLTEQLPARSGQLQAAVGLELKAAGFSHVNIHYNMVNGQLPNLDLLNLADRLIEKEGFIATIHKGENAEDGTFLTYSIEGLQHYTQTSLKGLYSQATGRPSGLHGVFGQYGIEAVSLEPYVPNNMRGRRNRNGDVGNMARIMEGMLRSINNLLERFHQSFFFYVLPSTKRYISISYYMPALGLILLAPLLKACCIWIELIPEGQSDTVASSDTPESAEPLTDNVATREGQCESPGLLSCIPAWASSHLLGFSGLLLPWIIRSFGSSFTASDSGLWTGDLVVSGFAALAVVALSFPLLFRKMNSKRGRPFTGGQSSLLRCATLLELSLLLGAVGLLNFSLGFVLSVLIVPVIILVYDRSNRFMWLLQCLLLLLVNPLTIGFLLSGVYVFTTDPDLAIIDWANVPQLLHLCTPEFVGRSLDLLKTHSLTIITDWYYFDAWLYPLICAGLLSIWTQLWVTVNAANP